MSKTGIATANKHIVTLIKTYTLAKSKFPFCNNCKVSKLKVEKVLNPPQKPVASSNRVEVFKSPRTYKCDTKPITTHAKMFAKKVDQGNSDDLNVKPIEKA